MPTAVKLTEAAFTDQVIALARLRGWRVLHIRPARTSKGWRTPVQGDGVGFPDLFLVRNGDMVFAELKVGKNTATPEQDAWLTDLTKTGAATFVWHPDHWPVIERVLEHGSEAAEGVP